MFLDLAIFFVMLNWPLVFAKTGDFLAVGPITASNSISSLWDMSACKPQIAFTQCQVTSCLDSGFLIQLEIALFSKLGHLNGILL